MSLTISSSDSNARYIVAMYIVGALSLMLALARRAVYFENETGPIVLSALTIAFSLIGKIMSLVRRSRSTMNRSKFVLFFSIILMAGSLDMAGVIIFDTLTRRQNTRHNMWHGLVNVIIGCSLQFLVGISSAVILFFTSSRENENCPKLPQFSKIIIGISGILASVAGIVRECRHIVAASDIHYAMAYTQIVFVSFVGIGIFAGFIFGYMQYRRCKINKMGSTSQLV